MSEPRTPFTVRDRSPIPRLNNLDTAKVSAQMSEIESTINTSHKVTLTEQTCPVLRDSGDGYKPLERLFGILKSSNAFGESYLLSPFEAKARFY